MELEKSKEILKRELCNIVNLIEHYTFENLDYDKKYRMENFEQAISAVLQALDNSIPKEKVINEIKELDNMKVGGEVFTTAVDFAKKTLQELLEE